MEPDNPKIDHNEMLNVSEYLEHFEKLFQAIKGCIQNNVAIHHQVDTTKVKDEGKVTIRIFIDFKKKAPTMAEAFPNPFESLPECEEPVQPDGNKPKEEES